ncbi:MAG: hypothetical protein CMM03_17420 [Rhodopirellula sp.]|nr:hypothetical protein [Rhodopirellula sp.]
MGLSPFLNTVYRSTWFVLVDSRVGSLWKSEVKQDPQGAPSLHNAVTEFRMNQLAHQINRITKVNESE